MQRLLVYITGHVCTHHHPGIRAGPRGDHFNSVISRIIRVNTRKSRVGIEPIEVERAAHLDDRRAGGVVTGLKDYPGGVDPSQLALGQLKKSRVGNLAIIRFGRNQLDGALSVPVACKNIVRSGVAPGLQGYGASVRTGHD